jgi:hypothetical protein
MTPAYRTLTYCTNIHPGEGWADVLENLEHHALAVKAAFAPDASFPLGLRLSAQAAAELDAGRIARFRDWCATHGCHVATINGFPYGPFHGRAVKEAVYQPDWRMPQRADYTCRLADIAAQWCPPGATMSISTVPIAFRSGFAEPDWALVRNNLIDALTHLARLRDAGRATIALALEPEPYCVLERTVEVLDCFERLRLPPSLAPFLGVCLDACHQAVQFETPADCLGMLAAAGVPLLRVQVSSALRARGAAIGRLRRFDEPTYLHQAVLRTAGGRMERYADLPQLLATGAGRDPDDECRVHFHVPIFLRDLDGIGTTRDFLEALLPRVPAHVPLEVETYSFGVLPAALRAEPLAAMIVRELTWVKELLDATHRRD